MKGCRKRESAVFKWNKRKSVGPLLSEQFWYEGIFLFVYKAGTYEKALQKNFAKIPKKFAG